MESEGVSQSPAIFTGKGNSIDSKTEIFSPKRKFDCGGTRRKIAAVYASKPNSRSDLIYLRFYVYSDKKGSKMVSDQLRNRNEDIGLRYASCL